MKEYSDASLKAERRFLEKRLVVLSTLGNNTPFIGLLGTVLGIMKAFRDLAAMGDSGPAVKCHALKKFQVYFLLFGFL
ncbi:MAG: MotA/TolQ/ExbB proton channel family protein [Leptospira sp.]|nr:MotA/TolQ/ExbB proton channel family protein [Leptospira sp.]